MASVHNNQVDASFASRLWGLTFADCLSRLLDKLFLTRVRLDSPASGAAAEQHRRQLAQDAADLTAERNLQELTSFGIAKWDPETKLDAGRTSSQRTPEQLLLQFLELMSRLKDWGNEKHIY